MDNFTSSSDTVNLSGYRQDSTACDAPTNPSVALRDLPGAPTRNAKCSFNKISIPIRTDHGIKRTASNSFPGILDIRQSGLITSEDFSSQVTKLKVQQLEQSDHQQLQPSMKDHLSQEFNVSFHPFESITCGYVVPYNSFYIGAWAVRNRTMISLTKTRREYINGLLCTTGITHQYITNLRREHVSHICPANLDGAKYILICSNSLCLNDSNYCRLIPVDEELNSVQLPGHELEHHHHRFYSCAWNSKQKIIAISSEKYLCVSQLDITNGESHYLKFHCQNYRPVEFSDSGNIVYTVGPQGNLIGIDLRTDDITDIASIGNGVEYIKMLKNDYTLIASGYDNKLSNIDIRMAGVVFRYPGFRNKNLKIPFTFDEDWNVLCSSNQGNVTRFWNLKNGEALASLNPPSKSIKQAYSVLGIEKNNLSTSIFVDEKMYYYGSLCHENTGIC